MFRSFRTIILFCVLLCASAAAETQERSFANVVDWVRRDGKPNTVWDVAIAMKIQTGANRAVQKIIVKMDLKRFYGMQVYDDQTDVIMSRNSQERTVAWRVTQEGKILQTLTFVGARKDAKIVPNDQYMDWWNETLDVLAAGISSN